jgi:endonuclease/exonuclease/phosphatase (EEP) superfamily protein YafD
VAATHLTFVRGWNAVQLRRLLRSLAGTREPLVLLGDLNMQPRAASAVSGLRPLASALTFPAGAPSRQLDHVLARGRLTPTGPAVAPQMPLSDHRPLVVEVHPA